MNYVTRDITKALIAPYRNAWPANRLAGTRAPLIILARHHFTVVVDYVDTASDLTRATLALL